MKKRCMRLKHILVLYLITLLLGIEIYWHYEEEIYEIKAYLGSIFNYITSWIKIYCNA